MPWIRLQTAAYWIVVVIAFLGVAIWESFCAARKLSIPAERRWRNHALVYFAGIITMAALFRTGPMVVAAAVETSRYGLLNRPWIPVPARWVFAVLLLDLVRYASHRAFHAVGFLWRVHQVHHSDPDVDVSTGFRTHPLEQLLTRGAYLGAVAGFAAPVSAVLMLELCSAFQTFFSHANAHLPQWLDRVIRTFWVTPDMHRIHHSQEVLEEQSNFGEVFPWWDHLFGTYTAAPLGGQDGFGIGLKGFQNARSLDFAFMMSQPFSLQAGLQAGAGSPSVDRAEISDYQRDQSL